MLCYKHSILHGNPWPGPVPLTRTPPGPGISKPELTKQIKIVPAWLKGNDTRKAAQRIYIDSHMAFGTGLHPTTKYTAQLIEAYRGKYGRFLDVGTGTGLLSIIAEKNKAQEILAIDVDGEAVKTARENILLNGCRKVKLKKMDLQL